MSDRETNKPLSDGEHREPLTEKLRCRQLDAACYASASGNEYEAPVAYLPVKPVTTLYNGRSNTQTMFGHLSDDRITFVVDTSGSMYGCLEAVKSHLVEAVNELCARPNSYVNLIKFDSGVVKWTDKMV